MHTDELRDALLAVPGVADAHVAEGEGTTPIVRVWLDGSRSEADVSDEINDVVASRGFRGVSATTGAGSASPTTPSGLMVLPGTGAIASVAIEESQQGVAVRVTNTAGVESVESIRQGPMAMEEAVLEAVARLLTIRAPRLVAVEDRPMEGSQVVVTLVEAEHGRRAAGSAVVVGGKPFALARAIHAALAELV